MAKNPPEDKWTRKQLGKFKKNKAATEAENITRRAEGRSVKRSGRISKGPSPKDKK